MQTPTRSRILLGLALVCAAWSCSDGDDSGCIVNPLDTTQYVIVIVIVGFWTTSDCSGDPVAQNAFPGAKDAPCDCWPGHSGENSADTFVCDAAAKTFTYTQFNSLTGGAGDTTPTVKTVTMDCKQDIPPTLSPRIVNFGACGG